MLPFELHSDASDTDNENSNVELKKLIKPLVSVIYVNGDYYVHQGSSLKHGIGLGLKCKSDRYFITDVIEKLASKAFIVVSDSHIEELNNNDKSN